MIMLFLLVIKVSNLISFRFEKCVDVILVSLEKAYEIVDCCSRNHVPRDCIGLCMTFKSQIEGLARSISKSRSISKPRSVAHYHCWNHIETITKCKIK